MFEAACGALLSGSSSTEQRREADKWITEFQKSKEAWAVVDSILSREDVPVSLAFLAAKTFQTKLRFDYHEQVAPQERVPLREMLLSHLSRQAAPERRPVATQLALAVAALVLQMEEWDGAIKDLAARFGGQAQAESGNPFFLIELLQVIPEEHAEGSLNLSAERRTRLTIEIYDCGPDVLGFLERCASQSGGDSGTLANILKCLRAWVSIPEIPGELLARSPLLPGLFNCLTEDSTQFDLAVNVLTSILRKYNIKDDPGHAAVMESVVPRIFQMEAVYLKAKENEDEELTQGLAKLFTGMADAYREIILGPEDIQQEKLLSLVTSASEHPSFEVAASTWHFWQRFLDHFLSLPPALLARRKDQFMPLFERLLYACLQHLELPDEHPNREQVCTRELEEDFYYNRRDIADILMLFGDLVDAAHVLTVVKGELEKQIKTEGEPSIVRWQRVEALLCASNSVAKVCTFTSSSSATHVAVDFIMNSCLRLPNVSLLLRESATRVFGSYAKFLRFNPQKLEPVISYALDTLVHVPKIGSTATVAILKIAEYCRKDMMVVGTRLLQASQSPNADIRIQERLDLIESLAMIVSEQDRKQAATAIDQVAQPALELISRIAGQVVVEQAAVEFCGNQASVDSMAFAIRTIETLIKYGWKGDDHPAQGLFQQLWPSLSTITKALCSHRKIAERLATLYKVVIRGFGRAFEPYLAQFLSIMVDGFQRALVSPFVYAAGIAMDFFVYKAELVPDFIQILAAFSRRMVEITAPGLAAYETHPDVVEDFFITMDRSMRSMKLQVLDASFFGETFHCAVGGILLEHPQAARSLYLYIESCVSAAKERPQVVHSCLDRDGREMLSSLVAGIAGKCPRTAISSRSEGSLGMTLWTACLLLNQQGGIAGHIMQALKSPYCSHVNQNLAQWFVQELTRAKTFPEFDDTLHEFSSRARLRLLRQVKQQS